MKEKEKSKSNPFIKELRPGEEILWLSAPPSNPFSMHFNRYGLRIVGGIVAFATIFGVFVTITDLADLSSPIPRSAAAVAGRLVGSILAALVLLVPLSFPLFVIIFGFLRQDKSYPLRNRYAVTNQRLLLYRDDRTYVQTHYLDEMKELRTHKWAVAFVQTFAHIDDVEEVAHLMEEAREQLLAQKKAMREDMLAEASIAFDADDLSRRAKR